MVQDRGEINLNAEIGVAACCYLTQDEEETDYDLFVNKNSVGVIETKQEDGSRLIPIEEQSNEYVQHDELKEKATEVFYGELNLFIDNVRRVREQTIDMAADTLVNQSWATDSKEKTQNLKKLNRHE